ncbi:MAG: hypothetical protein WCH04_07060 [Gammaproteobacteria bacterium]
MFYKMSFNGDDKIELFVDNESMYGTCSMKGNQVTVTGQGGSVVFTLNADKLETTVEGQHAVCAKL